MYDTFNILLSGTRSDQAPDSRRVRWLREIDRFQSATWPSAGALRWRAVGGDCVAITGTPAAWRPLVLRVIGEAVATARGRDAVVDVERIELPSGQAPIDLLPLPRGQARRRLIDVGLDCAWQQATNVAALGEAERWQLRLAIALTSAAERSRPALVLADRWCHELDTIAARRLCRRMRRTVSQLGILLVIETARHELLSTLRPEIHLQLRGARFDVHGPKASRLECTNRSFSQASGSTSHSRRGLF